MDEHFFIGVLFGLGLAYALFKIFNAKITDEARGYIIIIMGIGIFLLIVNHFGCGYISRTGRSNK